MLAGDQISSRRPDFRHRVYVVGRLSATDVRQSRQMESKPCHRFGCCSRRHHDVQISQVTDSRSWSGGVNVASVVNPDTSIGVGYLKEIRVNSVGHYFRWPWRQSGRAGQQCDERNGHEKYARFKRFDPDRNDHVRVSRCDIRSIDCGSGEHTAGSQGNTGLHSADGRGLRCVPHEFGRRRKAHEARRGFPKEPQVVIGRTRSRRQRRYAFPPIRSSAPARHTKC
jgi:hypothetical protein